MNESHIRKGTPEFLSLLSTRNSPVRHFYFSYGMLNIIFFGSGCRADASEAAIILLPSNITVFTLDFSGSGLSGGEHVTLGWKEVSV